MRPHADLSRGVLPRRALLVPGAGISVNGTGKPGAVRIAQRSDRRQNGPQEGPAPPQAGWSLKADVRRESEHDEGRKRAPVTPLRAQKAARPSAWIAPGLFEGRDSFIKTPTRRAVFGASPRSPAYQNDGRGATGDPGHRLPTSPGRGHFRGATRSAADWTLSLGGAGTPN